MTEHQAAGVLGAALKYEVQEIRQMAADEINPIDARRQVLAGRIGSKSGRASGSHLPSGPVVPRRQAEQELRQLDLEREQRNQALVRDVEQLVATAQIADYVYRQAFEAYSASGHRPKPVEFDLPATDTGPIPDPLGPDPLGPESPPAEPPDAGLRVVGNDPR
jgi:hypothetical protein